jgi:site-specific recombinase
MTERKDLDAILAHTPAPTASLGLRLGWMADVLHWILSDSALRTDDAYFKTGETQALRVKWVLHILERHPDWKEKVRKILESIPPQTQIFDLLVMTGLHQQAGLFSEILERLQKEYLPAPKDEANLQFLFLNAFDSNTDAESFLRINNETFQELTGLFNVSSGVFNVWSQNYKDACLFLSLQISGLGLDTEVRRRLKVRRIDEICFYALHEKVLSWSKVVFTSATDTTEVLRTDIKLTVQVCSDAIQHIYAQMDDHGVSVSMVYRLDRIEALLRRLLLLVEYSGAVSANLTKRLISQLISESVRSRRIGSLIDDNTSLIAKKIVENSAETGEHYIARSVGDYFKLLKKALGGGIVTAITVVVKIILSLIPGSPFLMGFLASINYSASFLLIQMRGFTLATKQPAMTAAALAGKVRPDIQETELSGLVTEIIYLVRSQVIAVIGNVMAVVPTMLIFCWAFGQSVGSSFLTAKKAENVIGDFSILGMTPIYAIMTGFFLFLSSIIAGWFYNWVLYRRLHHALAQSNRLVAVFGKDRMRVWSLLFKANCAGFAGNISLGFFLGLVPVFADFLGLPIDVRHVTLSSGMLSAAVMSLELTVLQTTAFWLAVAGVVSMAFLNLLVSFLLALLVAFRAKKIPLEQGFTILRIIVVQLLRHPMLLFWPPQNTVQAPTQNK